MIYGRPGAPAWLKEALNNFLAARDRLCSGRLQR